MSRLDQNKAPIHEALEQFKYRRVVPFDVPGHKHNVIKIREYVVKNRYERYHVCSFFIFFTAKKQKNT